MMIADADLDRKNGAAGCVLATGKFDPFHAGHLRYLQMALRHAQRKQLIVLVAPDDELGRPAVVPAPHRIALLSELGFPVYDTPCNLPTAIQRFQPALLVKGRDWEHHGLERYGVPVIYTDTMVGSSGQMLRAYQRVLDDRAVRHLEDFIQAQKSLIVKPWKPVTDYSVQERDRIEGIHHELIWEHLISCDDADVLDYGCGPDGHLVRLLHAYQKAHPSHAEVCIQGYDPLVTDQADPWLTSTEPCDGRRFDLVICREVLEHCKLTEIRQLVHRLVDFSSRLVYVTTRHATRREHLLSVESADGLDPTHITMGTKDFLRMLFVLEGCRSRRDLEGKMDWQQKGRCLVFETRP